MHFEDSELSKLGAAFDRAWDRFLQTGMLTTNNLYEARDLLARRIVQCAARGERDEWRLARHGLFGLWQTQLPAPSRGPPGTMIPVERSRSIAH
jgi:hypothetical protein